MTNMKSATKKMDAAPAGKRSMSTAMGITAVLAIIASVALHQNFRTTIDATLGEVKSWMNTFDIEQWLEHATISDRMSWAVDEIAAKVNGLEAKLVDGERKHLTGYEEHEPHYHMSQFMEYFRVEPLDDMEVAPNLVDALAKYDYATDPEYLSRKSEYDGLIEQYAQYVVDRPASQDDRFYVKFSPQLNEYALYARAPLPRKAVLGFFTGVVREQGYTAGDAWKFRGTLLNDDGSPKRVVIDGRFKSNWFYFLRIHDKGNVRLHVFPYKNMWYVLFEARRPIAIGEELFLGDDDVTK